MNVDCTEYVEILINDDICKQSKRTTAQRNNRAYKQGWTKSVSQQISPPVESIASELNAYI